MSAKISMQGTSLVVDGRNRLLGDWVSSRHQEQFWSDSRIQGAQGLAVHDKGDL
jgi:hypothetical protein